MSPRRAKVPHGTRNGYEHYGCRCDDCRHAYSVWQRARRPAPADPYSDAALELERVPHPGDWISHARCAGQPVTVFFPADKEDPRPAKRICAQCPVATPCAAYAIDAGYSLHGVWGGLTEDERVQLRRDRRIGA